MRPLHSRLPLASSTALLLALLTLAPACGGGSDPIVPPAPPPPAAAPDPVEPAEPTLGEVQGVVRADPSAPWPSSAPAPVDGCPTRSAPTPLGPDRELADAIVLLHRGARRAGTATQPPAAAPPADHVLTLSGCALDRAAIVARLGDRLVLHNDDERYHALGLSELDGGQARRVQSLPLAPKERDVTFALSQPGFYAITSDQLPAIEGLLLVLRPQEVGAATAADGTFTLGELAPGSWNAAVRHARLGERRTTVEVVQGETAALYEVLGSSAPEE